MEPNWDDAKLPQLFRESSSTRAPNVTSHATNIQAAFRCHHVHCNISDDLPWDIAEGQHPYHDYERIHDWPFEVLP